MSRLRIYGDQSGYLDLVAPDSASNQVINLDGLINADSNGNVGIGTSSPNKTLHVYRNDIDTSAQVLIEQAGTGDASIGFLRTGVYNWMTGIDNTDNKYKISGSGEGLDTNNYLAIDTNGNVGIGTQSPAYKFDVVDDIDGSHVARVNNASTGSNSVSILQLATGARYVNLVTAYASQYFQILGSNISTYYRDFDTHIFRNSAGTERMRIKSDGKVGIGSSNPAFKLDVDGGSLGTNAADEIEAFRLLTSTTNADNLNFKKIREAAGSDWTTAGWRIQQKIDATDMGYIQFNGSGNLQGLSFGTANTERMRIKSDGEVQIAGTSDRGTYNLQVNGTGVWAQGGYTNGSDERMKEEIADLNDGLEVVNQLRPVTYRYREEFSEDRNTQAGFIAQELKQALSGKNYAEGTVPEGPEYLSVAYQNLIPVLTKAIQEQQTQIEAQQATISALEERITALEST